MSVAYKPVIWNRNKYWYDAALIGFIVLYIAFFVRYAPGWLDAPQIDGATLRMRAFGTCAFFMLTFILCIGPLARLDRRFLPLLYNRRHFGVLTFFVSLVHVQAVLGWYFAFSPENRYVAALNSSTVWDSFLAFPIEWLGVVALLILFIMMATSHDFWLSFLTPPVWKTLHMGVYLAYAALVMHVALGIMQSEPDPLNVAMFGLCLVAVVGLHVAAGAKEAAHDRRRAATLADDGWLDVAAIEAIPQEAGTTVTLPAGERVALFRHGNKISALTNVCAHQNGPLGEGRVIDGCVTCPWHGFQYNPENGCAPAPFTEKIATYRIRRVGARVWLDPNALPPGTPTDPIVLAEAEAS